MSSNRQRANRSSNIDHRGAANAPTHEQSDRSSVSSCDFAGNPSVISGVFSELLSTTGSSVLDARRSDRHEAFSSMVEASLLRQGLGGGPGGIDTMRNGGTGRGGRGRVPVRSDNTSSPRVQSERVSAPSQRGSISKFGDQSRDRSRQKSERQTSEDSDTGSSLDGLLAETARSQQEDEPCSESNDSSSTLASPSFVSSTRGGHAGTSHESTRRHHKSSKHHSNNKSSSRRPSIHDRHDADYDGEAELVRFRSVASHMRRSGANAGSIIDGTSSFTSRIQPKQQPTQQTSLKEPTSPSTAMSKGHAFSAGAPRPARKGGVVLLPLEESASDPTNGLRSPTSAARSPLGVSASLSRKALTNDDDDDDDDESRSGSIYSSKQMSFTHTTGGNRSHSLKSSPHSFHIDHHTSQPSPSSPRGEGVPGLRIAFRELGAYNHAFASDVMGVTATSAAEADFTTNIRNGIQHEQTRRHMLHHVDLNPTAAPGLVPLHRFLHELGQLEGLSLKDVKRRASLERIALEHAIETQIENGTVSFPQSSSTPDPAGQGAPSIEDYYPVNPHLRPVSPAKTATEQEFGLFNRLHDEEAFSAWLGLPKPILYSDRQRMEKELEEERLRLEEQQRAVFDEKQREKRLARNLRDFRSARDEAHSDDDDGSSVISTPTPERGDHEGKEQTEGRSYSLGDVPSPEDFAYLSMDSAVVALPLEEGDDQPSSHEPDASASFVPSVANPNRTPTEPPALGDPQRSLEPSVARFRHFKEEWRYVTIADRIDHEAQKAIRRDRKHRDGDTGKGHDSVDMSRSSHVGGEEELEKSTFSVAKSQSVQRRARRANASKLARLGMGAGISMLEIEAYHRGVFCFDVALESRQPAQLAMNGKTTADACIPLPIPTPNTPTTKSGSTLLAVFRQWSVTINNAGGSKPLARLVHEDVTNAVDEVLAHLDRFCAPLSFDAFSTDVSHCLRALEEGGNSSTDTMQTLLSQGDYLNQLFDDSGNFRENNVPMEGNGARKPPAQPPLPSVGSGGGLPEDEEDECLLGKEGEDAAASVYVQGPVLLRVPYTASVRGDHASALLLAQQEASDDRISSASIRKKPQLVGSDSMNTKGEKEAAANVAESSTGGNTAADTESTFEDRLHHYKALALVEQDDIYIEEIKKRARERLFKNSRLEKKEEDRWMREPQGGSLVKNAAEEEEALDVSSDFGGGDPSTDAWRLEAAAAARNVSATDLVAAYLDAMSRNECDDKLRGRVRHLGVVDVGTILSELRPVSGVSNDPVTYALVMTGDGKYVRGEGAKGVREATLPTSQAKTINVVAPPAAATVTAVRGSIHHHPRADRASRRASLTFNIPPAAPLHAGSTTSANGGGLFSVHAHRSLSQTTSQDHASSSNSHSSSGSGSIAENFQAFGDATDEVEADVTNPSKEPTQWLQVAGSPYFLVPKPSNLPLSGDQETPNDSDSKKAGEGDDVVNAVKGTTHNLRALSDKAIRLAFDMDYREAVSGGAWLNTVGEIIDHVRHQQLETCHLLSVVTGSLDECLHRLVIFLNSNTAKTDEDVIARDEALARIWYIRAKLSTYSADALALEKKVSDFDMMRDTRQQVQRAIDRALLPVEDALSALLVNVPFPQQSSRLAGIAPLVIRHTAAALDFLAELAAASPPFLGATEVERVRFLNSAYLRLQSCARSWSALSMGFVDPVLERVVIDSDPFSRTNRRNPHLSSAKDPRHPGAFTVGHYLFEDTPAQRRNLHELLHINSSLPAVARSDSTAHNQPSQRNSHFTATKGNTSVPTGTTASSSDPLGKMTVAQFVERLATEYRATAEQICEKVKATSSETIGLQLLMSSRYVLGKAGPEYDTAWGFSMPYLA